jgi:AcrR family transcriptional regulator
MRPDAQSGAPARRRPLISREFIEAHRRRRFFIAAAEIAHEFGRRGVTATTLCQVAHTARNTFYENFASVDDCLRQGVGEAYLELFAPLALPDATEEWPSLVEQEIGGLYRRIAAEPLLAELLLVHSFSLDGGSGAPAYEDAVTAVMTLLGPGRELAATRGLDPPPFAEEAAARMIVDLAARALLGGLSDGLPGEARPMALLAAGGLIGSAEAARLIERGPAARRSSL